MNLTSTELLELTDFQKVAIAISLNKMFNGNHYDICVVRETAKLLGRASYLGGPDFEALHLLHCVNWGDMGKGMAKEVREKTAELLGISLASESAEPTKPEGTSLWKRLLSKP